MAGRSHLTRWQKRPRHAVRGPSRLQDRLNDVVTPSGWTREYTVHTVSPIARMKKDKTLQSGKVLITCVVTIPSIGTHSGSGEEWAR